MNKKTQLTPDLEATARAALVENGGRQYTRVPFEIEAMPVTGENFEIIGDLVGGEPEYDHALGVQRMYVDKVSVISGPPTRRRRMYFQNGDVLTRYRGKVRIYDASAFEREFTFVREGGSGLATVANDIDAVFTFANVYKSTIFTVLACDVAHLNMVPLHRVFGVEDSEGSGVDYVEMRTEYLKSPNPRAVHGVRAPLGHFIVLYPGFLRIYNPKAFHETFRVFPAPVPAPTGLTLVLGETDAAAADAV